MRLRIHRLVLLLAKLLLIKAQEESDRSQISASESIHSDSFRLPSLHHGEGVAQQVADSRGNKDDESIRNEGDADGSDPIAQNSQNQQMQTSDSPGTTIIEDSIAEKESSEAGHDNSDNNLQDADDKTVDSSGTTISSNSDGTNLPKKEQTNEDGIDDDEEESLKDRVSVDYASKSAGALIIEKSSGFKGTSNLLNGDKDKYAITPCEEKKFVVISLSEDILVKTIKLANYERFSSSVKDFQVMGSQTLGKWVDLGTYTAKAGNGEQVFELREPAWSRYLKFKFLTHHNYEYYCTFSQIKVHGSTMVQGFHEQWEENDDSEEQIDDDTDSSINEASSTPKQNKDSLSDDEIDSIKTESEEPESLEKETEGSAILKQEGEEPNIMRPNIKSLHPSSALDEILHGGITDREDLFIELFNLIPTTLNALTPASRHLPTRGTPDDSDLTTPQKLSSLSMQSIYQSARAGVNSAIKIVAETSDMIVTPKMTDNAEEVVKRYIGNDVLKIETSLESMPNHADSNHAGNDDSIEQGTAISVNLEAAPETYHVEESQPPKKNDAAIAERDQSSTKNYETDDARDITADEMDSSPTESNISSLTNPESVVEGAKRNESTEFSVDISLAKLLESLPSSSCLLQLDFVAFKAKANSGNGHPQTAGTMEPIFKKLTDEIKSLQSSLHIHDQFTKASVSCYQRILFDITLEMEKLRIEHSARLTRVEELLLKSQMPLYSRFWQWCINFAPAIFQWGTLLTQKMVYFIHNSSSWLLFRAVSFFRRIALSTTEGLSRIMVHPTEDGSSAIKELSSMIREFCQTTGPLNEQLCGFGNTLQISMIIAIVTVAVCFVVLARYFTARDKPCPPVHLGSNRVHERAADKIGEVNKENTVPPLADPSYDSTLDAGKHNHPGPHSLSRYDTSRK